jgi:hypothetical protein
LGENGLAFRGRDVHDDHIIHLPHEELPMTLAYAPISETVKVDLSIENPLDLGNGSVIPDYAFVMTHRIDGTPGMICLGKSEDWDMLLTASEARELATALLGAAELLTL